VGRLYASDCRGPAWAWSSLPRSEGKIDTGGIERGMGSRDAGSVSAEDSDEKDQDIKIYM
jgi:hypothetical protein